MCRIVCGVWMWVALVALSSYSGNLKAFLMTPTIDKPVESLADLVKSNLKWNFVLYGEPSEKVLETSQDPVLKKFWQNKEVVKYKDFPYERMKEVYKGNSVMIEYVDYIRTIVEAAFTLPNGEPLVHVPKSVGFNSSGYATWAFHPLNPWLGRFEPFLLRFMETGLRNRWAYLARRAFFLFSCRTDLKLTRTDKTQI